MPMTIRIASRSPLWAAVSAILLFLAAAIALDAAGPVFWQTSSRTEFLKGDVEDLSVDSDGRLLIGPAMQAVCDTNAPFLWATVPGADGSLYVGTGNEGKVLHIDKTGKASVFYDSPELEVHALALAPGGGLYVGTSP